MSGVYSSVGRVARGVLNCTIGAWRRIGSTIANAAIGAARYSTTSASNGTAATSSTMTAMSSSIVGRYHPPSMLRTPHSAISPVSFVRRALPLHFPFTSWLLWGRSITTNASRRAGGGGGGGGRGDGVGLLDQEWEESLFTRVADPTFLSFADVNRYFLFSDEMRAKTFGEGVPGGLAREFATTKVHAVLVRERVLKLIEAMQIALGRDDSMGEEGEIADSMRKSFGRNFLLDGPVGSGKSVALAMAVHWARTSGWLVIYVPSGREWTRGGFFQKHPATALWDTPVAAKNVLQGLMNSHEDLLASLPLKVDEPIPVEAVVSRPGRIAAAPSAEANAEAPAAAEVAAATAGEEVGGSLSLRDLVARGLKMTQPHALVDCVVRLRKELSKVTDVPVLIAIDEYNSWFGYSDYQEFRGQASRRMIRADELRMVNAFRSMVDSPLEKGVVVAANSNSISAGNLPVNLPGVPPRVRYEIPRYSAQETAMALHYYHRCNVGFNDPTADDIKRMFFLTAGNGDELRTLAHLL